MVLSPSIRGFFFIILAIEIANCLNCANVRPIWNKITGRPTVERSMIKNNEAIVTWSLESVIYGAKCVQAFEVEHQHFGIGQKHWSHWSSIPGCAIILQKSDPNEHFTCTKHLTDFECGKRLRFRVLLHNIFNQNQSVVASVIEEVLIECKPVRTNLDVLRFLEINHVQVVTDKIFYVRAPNRNSIRYKATKIGTTSERVTPIFWTTPTPISYTSTTTTTMYPGTPKMSRTSLPTPTTSVMEASSERSPSVMESPITSRPRKIKHDTYFRKTLLLLPGNYTRFQARKSYEVRANLKNFTANEQTLDYCSVFLIYEMTYECDKRGDIHRGMSACFVSTTPSRVPGKAHRDRKGNFKMLMDPDCQGTFFYLKHISQCQECHESETLIIV